MVSAERMGLSSCRMYRGYPPSSIPSFQVSDDAEYSSIHPLLHQHPSKRLHQRTQTILRPVRNMLIQHQSLTKQRMRAVLRRIHLQPPVIPQTLSRRPQLASIANALSSSIRSRRCGREMRIDDNPIPKRMSLDVAKARLDSPTFPVISNQRARPHRVLARHHTPRLFHLPVLHAHHRAHLQFMRIGHLRIP